MSHSNGKFVFDHGPNIAKAGVTILLLLPEFHRKKGGLSANDPNMVDNSHIFDGNLCV